MQTPLIQNENVLKEGQANLQRGFETVGGKLFLTNQRLIFEAHAINFQSSATLIPLSTISGTRNTWTKLFNLIPLMPNSLAVATNKCKEYNFVLFDRQKWSDAIASCLPNALTPSETQWQADMSKNHVSRLRGKCCLILAMSIVLLSGAVVSGDEPQKPSLSDPLRQQLLDEHPQGETLQISQRMTFLYGLCQLADEKNDDDRKSLMYELNTREGYNISGANTAAEDLLDALKHDDVLLAAFDNDKRVVEIKNVERYLEKVYPLVARMKTQQMLLSLQIKLSVKRFQEKFNDLKTVKVFLIPSLFDFDAKTVPYREGRALVVGVDWFADNSNENLDVLFAHELFHLYHQQNEPEEFAEYLGPASVPMPLYKTLWTEGLATYVSHQMNPSVSLSDIFLGDKELIEKGPHLLATVTPEIIQNLDSKSPKESTKFFAYAPSRKGEELPSRFGYYLGMKVAEKLSAKYSLMQLAHLHGEELRAEIESALRSLTEANG